MSWEEIHQDTRLSSDARVVVMELYRRGGEWLEVSHAEWSMLLNQAGDHRVRKALDNAKAAGWLERKVGGGGHSDRYRIRVENFATLQDSLQKNGCLKPEKGGEFPQAILDRVEKFTRLGGDSRGGKRSEDVDDAGSRAGAREELAESVEKAIDQHTEKLAGCRDALRDYLRSRVPPERQYAYVQTVAGWLDGLDPSVWRRPNGHPLPDEDRTAVLAYAMNDLAGSDESAMKRPMGDPANLRTKVGVLITQRESRRPWEREKGRDEGGLSASDREIVEMRERYESVDLEEAG